MEKLDDLRSFPSPVFVVPDICRGDSLHSAEQVSQMINSHYQTCQGESARSTQLVQQHLGPGLLGPCSAQGEERLLTREETSASTGKTPAYATARTTTRVREFATAALVAFNLDWSNLWVQTFETETI